MRKLLLILVVSTLMIACKSKNDKVQDFVKMYNRSTHLMASSAIKSSKASSTNADEVNIEVNTTYSSQDMENQLVGAALPELIGQAIKSEKLGQELLNEGVKFNLKVYGSDARVIADEVIDKNTTKGEGNFSSIARGNKPSSSELNTILEAFNKNLPMEDKSSGITIMSIKADESNNIIYTAQVPDTFKSMLEIEGAEQMMKDEMLRSPQIQQIFSRTEVLGVNNLKYIYTDMKGNVIKEITITKQDLK